LIASPDSRLDLDGSEFDGQYIEVETKNQKQQALLCEKELALGRSPEMRALAAEVLSRFQQNLSSISHTASSLFPSAGARIDSSSGYLRELTTEVVAAEKARVPVEAQSAIAARLEASSTGRGIPEIFPRTGSSFPRLGSLGSVLVTSGLVMRCVRLLRF
jgi:hypothetical protein